MLSPPEQFLIMMSDIPRLSEKLSLLRDVQQFEVGMGPLCHMASAACCVICTIKPSAELKALQCVGSAHLISPNRTQGCHRSICLSSGL